MPSCRDTDEGLLLAPSGALKECRASLIAQQVPRAVKAVSFLEPVLVQDKSALDGGFFHVPQIQSYRPRYSGAYWAGRTHYASDTPAP